MGLSRERAFAVANRYAVPLVVAGGVADDIIDVAAMFEDWVPGVQYKVGDTRIWDGQPMTCREAYDASVHPDWTPEAYPAGWRPWHATSPERALGYVQPLGAGYEYMSGEYMRWGDEEHPEAVYECVKDNVVHTPGDRPDAWRVWQPTVDTETPTEEPTADEWPEWVQPVPGIADKPAYGMNAQVSHAGKRWISAHAANVWEPGTTGAPWKQA